MHSSIPAVSIPSPPSPPGQPLGISIFFLNGKFLRGGDKQVRQMPRVGTKKEGKCPTPGFIWKATLLKIILINHSKKVSLIIKTIKAGFHIIAMIAAIAGKNVQQSL